MPTDTIAQDLIINRLTKAQYDAAREAGTLSSTEMYMVSDYSEDVNNATITFTQGGVTKGSFTLNQSSDATIALDSGGNADVEWATYGTTTYQQISDWNTAGKIVCCQYGSNVFTLSLIGSIYHSFSNIIDFNTLSLRVNTSSVWECITNVTQKQIPAGTAGQVLTYTGTAGTVGSASLPTVDQTYDGTSTNAQSGVAIAGAGFIQNAMIITDYTA